MSQWPPRAAPSVAVPGFPPHELTDRPWFGQTSRGKSLLEEAGQQALAPELALVELRDVIGSEVFDAIHFVRFVDCRRTDKDNWRQHFMICHIDEVPAARQMVWDRAGDVVAAAGWYPVAAGRRLGTGLSKGSFAAQHPSRSIDGVVSGELASMELAVGADDGCALRVTTTSGQGVLLDTGLPDRLIVSTDDRLAVVTHAHLDHAGGFVSGKVNHLPVAMSSGTARILRDSGRIVEDQLRTVHFLTPGRWVSIGAQIEMSAVRVPHLPGALGVVLRDAQTVVVFTGDISVSSDRHDFTSQLCQIVRDHFPQKVYVALDATMAGRQWGASRANPARLARDRTSDLVVVGDSAEHLLYAYLDIYQTVMNSREANSVNFVVSAAVRGLLRLVHEAILGSELADVDPFLRRAPLVAGVAMWAESRWLFWLDGLDAAPDGRTVWFVTAQEAQGIPNRSADSVSVGRPGGAAEVAASRWNHLADADTTPWTLHSSESHLKDAISSLQRSGAKVVLFHNFRKRLRKFSRDASLECELLDRPVDFLAWRQS